MRVREIMTENPAFCLGNTELHEVARMMVDCDCGAIPVVESQENRRPIGIVTDRDIVTRSVALNKNPLQMRASDVMTQTTVTIDADSDVDQAMQRMKDNMIRRILVVDNEDKVVGIISQADIAIHTQHAEELVDKVSQPSRSASQTSRS